MKKLLPLCLTAIIILSCIATFGQAGSTCSNPINIASTPFTETDGSSCGFPGAGAQEYCGSSPFDTEGREIYYRFTPPASTCYRVFIDDFRIDPDGSGDFESDLSLSISEGCPTQAESRCIAANNLAVLNLEDYFFEASKEYYFVFDHDDFQNDCIVDLEWRLESCGIPECTNETLANDDCENATPICDLNGYCGSTEASQNDISNGVDHCGSIENNTWLTFTASSATVQLNAYAYNCTRDEGIQMWVGTSNNACNWSGAEADGIACEGGSGFGIDYNNFTINGLTPGETYYLMIDGFGGNVCKYVIEAVSGITPLVDAGEDLVICSTGSSFQLDGSSFATNSWVWSTEGSGNFTDSTLLDPTYTPSAADLAAGFVDLVLSHPGTGICQTPFYDTVRVSFVANDAEITPANPKICNGNSTTITARPVNGSIPNTSNHTIENTDPVAIPDDGVDNNWNGASGNFGSSEVDINCLNPNGWELTQYCVRINHPSPSPDITGVWLVNPCGVRIQLATGALNGCFAPGTSGAWNTFLSCANPNGTWELRVGDDWAFDQGSITEFSLTFQNENYTWSPAAGLSATNTSTVTANPTATTTYDVTIYDCASGCILTNQVTVEVSDITLTAVASDVLCNGDNTGQVVLTPADFVGNVSYRLSTGTYGPSNTFNGLSAGTYTFFARDDAGCEASTTVTINEPPVLDLTLTSAPASGCVTDNGSIQTQVSGGTSPYQYQFNGFGYGPVSTFTDLTAGTYTIDVRDANGCVDTETVTFDPIPHPTLNITNPGCGDLSTIFSIGSDIGTPTVSISDEPGMNAQFNPTGTANQFALTADDYGTATISVAVSAGGCDSTLIQEVTFLEQPVATINATPPPCDVLTTTLTIDPRAGNVNLSANPAATFTPTGNPFEYEMTVASPGSYTVTLQRDNGGCTDDTQTTVVFAGSKNPTAGADQSVCGKTTTLTANPAGGTWSTTDANINISNPNSTTTDVTLTNDNYGTYTIRYTIAGVGSCPDEEDPVTVTFFEQPDGFAGNDTTFCGVGSYQLNGTVVVGNGQWTSGTGIADPNDLNTSVSFATPGTYNYELTVTNGVCPPVTDNLVVQVDEKPLVNLPDSFIFCDLNGTLGGHSAVGTVTWTSPDPEISFADPNLSNTGISATAYGSYKVILTDNNASCPGVSDSAMVRFVEQPTPSASAQDSVCGKTLNLSATLSKPGNAGFWTGPGTFNPSKTDLNPTVTVTSFGNYTYTWTEVAHPSCPGETVTLNVEMLAPPAADAGADINVCGIFLPNANANPSTGNGSWSWTPEDTAQGTLVFSDLTDPNTSVTVDTAGVGFSGFGKYTLTWTEINGSSCPNSSDDKTVHFVPSSFPNAGADQEICGDTTQLQAIPSFGIGQWSYTGPGLLAFADNLDPKTLTYLNPSNPVYGEYTLIWTEANSPCTANRDTISLVFFEPPVFDAGISPDNVCGLTYTLNASSSIGSTQWTWKAINPTTGGLTFVDGNDSSETASLAVDTYGTYRLYWSVENGACAPPADSVELTFWERPSPEAQAPADICGTTPNQTIPLTGLASSGTQWTWTGPAGVTFVPDPFQTSVDANVSQYGTYKFFFNEENHPVCGVVADSIVVEVLEQPQADAGTDDNTCGASYAMQAGIPVGNGTGTWTVDQIISGTAGKTITFANANDSTTLATINPAPVVNPDTAFLVWTVQSGTSCPPISDTVRVVFEPEPQSFFAGNDTVLCDTLSTTLNADVLPSPTFSGEWKQITGPGTITFAGGNNTTERPDITADQYGSYKLTWTVNTASCPNGVVDDVVIDFREKPVSNAGPDIEVCGNDITLSAGTIPNRATANWYHTAGTAVIANPNQPTTTASIPGYSGTAAFVYEVRNGSVGPCAAPVRDTVIATLYKTPLANAGSDQIICGTTTVLNADSSVTQFTDAYSSSWTVLSGPGNVTFAPNASAPKANFSADAVGTYELQWKENNGTCPSDSAVVSVRFVTPAQPDAGVDNDTCALTISLSANPSFNIGKWMFDTTGVQGIFTNPNSFSTELTVDAFGTYRVIWEETNSPCPANKDTVLVSFNETPDALAINPKDTCGTLGRLSTTPSVTEAQYQGEWVSKDNPNLIINTPNSPTTTVDLNGEAPNVYEFWYIESNGSCPEDTALAKINFVPNPIPEAGNDTVVCQLSTVLDAKPASAFGDGTWTVQAPPGESVSFANANDPNTAITVSGLGIYRFAWTETNYGKFNLDCAQSDTVVVEFIQNPDPSLPDAIEVCGTSTQAIVSDLTTGSNITWSSNSLVIGAPNVPVTTLDAPGGTYGTYNLFFTESNRGICVYEDTIPVTFVEQPIADAGMDIDTCGMEATVAAIPTVGTGTWNFNGPGTIIFSQGQVNAPSQQITASTQGTYELIWSEENATPCSIARDTLFARFVSIPVSNAGNDTVVCGEEAWLNSIPSIGSGVWTYNGSLPITITNPNNANTLVTLNPTSVADYQTATFVWSEDNQNKCSDTDSVTVTFTAPPVAEAGTDQIICGLTTTLNGISNIGNKQWIAAATNLETADFANAAADTTEVTVPDYGDYRFGFIVSNGLVCAPDTDWVDVTFVQQADADAGVNDSICGSAIRLDATRSRGLGAWSVFSGPGNASFSDANAPRADATVDEEGTYQYIWSEAVTGCPTSTDTVSITYEYLPIANAGTDVHQCGLIGQLVGNNTKYTGEWSLASGEPGFNFSNPQIPNPTVSATAFGNYQAVWSVTNGNICPTVTDTISITFDEQPVANAGLNDSTCATFVTLEATPSAGSGTWTFADPNDTLIASFDTPDAPTTLMSHLSSTYKTLDVIYTEINGSVCAPSADTISVEFIETPEITVSGSTGVCGFQTTMNSTISAGTSEWRFTGGPGNSVFSDANAASTQIVVSQEGTYDYELHAANKQCESSFLFNIDFFPVPNANAGTDQVVCGLEAPLSATSTTNKGWWSADSNLTFADTADHNSLVRAPQYGTYAVYFSEYISNACPLSVDTTWITFNEQPIADAGTDQDVCGLSVSLNATPSVGEGFWSSTDPDITFSPDSSFPNAVASSANFGSYILVWNEFNAAPCDTSKDAIEVTFIELPTANFIGEDTTICSSTQATLTIGFTGVPQFDFEIVGSDGYSHIANTNSTTYSTAVTPGADTVFYRVIEVSDASDAACVNLAVDSFTVITHQDPEIHLSGGAAICDGESVSFSVVMDGDAPFTYNLSNGTSNTTQKNLEDLTVTPNGDEKIYLLSGTDSICPAIVSDTVVIDWNALPAAAMSLTNNPLCERDDFGIRLTNISGTLPIAAYYSTDQGSGSILEITRDTSILVEALVGMNAVRLDSIKNMGGTRTCPVYDVANIPLTVHQKPTLVTDLPEAICEATSTEMTFAFTGTAPFSVDLLTNGTLQTINNLSTLDTLPLGPTAPTTYEVVTVRDGNTPQCSATLSNMHQLDITPSPKATIALDDNDVCQNENVRVTLSFSGTAPFNYSLKIGENTLSSISNGSSATETLLLNQSSQIEIISLTDAATPACPPILPNPVNVVIRPLPNPNFKAVNTEGCQPFVTQFTNLTDPSEITSVFWDLGNDSVSTEIHPTMTYTASGNYDVSLIVTNGFNCSDTLLREEYIEIYPEPVADFGYEPQVISQGNSVVQFSNYTTNADNYTWDFNSEGTSMEFEPDFEFTLGDSSAVTVCLEAIGLCVDTVCKSIPVDATLAVHVPNAFSPNGDGKNEWFYPVAVGEDIQVFGFSIYNRWGQEIFHSQNPDDRWDGTFKGDPVQTGVYTYQVIVKEKFSPDREKIFGHVNVIR